MISVIIPTYNEAEQIGKTITHLWNAKEKKLLSEIIIVDGGSTDETIKIAQQMGAKAILSSKKGRAMQMNAGAAVSVGKVLYFLHADSFPPENFAVDIVKALSNDYSSGCYRLQFDHSHWFLKANCWFTRFDINAVRFGDQSLFVTKEVFQKCGGFDEKLIMMEDQEIIQRIRKYSRFTIMKDAVITSARKYLDNGVYRMQGIFFVIWFLYYVGFSQDRLLKFYRKLIRQGKL